MIGRAWIVSVAAALACNARESANRGQPTVALGSNLDLPSGPSGQCETSGCLRATEHVGDYSRETLQQVTQPGVTLENGYGIYTISFVSSGALARATVAVPVGVAAPAAGWHIVANAHGTTGLDDPCRVAGTLWGAALAGTFGARGFVGVAVDYPGLGTPGSHPYLVADSEGHAVLDAIRATQELARTQNIRLSKRAAIVGLSQGGHAALSAAARQRAYAPELDVRAVAVVGPASAFAEHWRFGIRYDGPFVAVHAMLIYAWAKHYGWHGPPLWDPAVAPNIDRFMQEACMYSATGAPSLADRLGTSAERIFSPEFLAAYRGGADWGAYAEFGTWFDANRIRPFPQTAAFKVFQGDQDDIVPQAATRQLVDALRGGGMKVEYEVVPGAGHSDVAFGFVASNEHRTAESIAWLRDQLR